MTGTSSAYDEKKARAPVDPAERSIDAAKKERYLENGDEGSSVDVQISERAMSWQRTTVLLFTEFIVLAILSFPSSYATLGMAGGVICTVIVCLSVLYTSLVLSRFCVAHPEARDIADVAYIVAGHKRWAWLLAFIGLALNNLFIMGLHVNAGATAINTLNHRDLCSAVWGIVLLVAMWGGSLILRDMRHTTIMGLVSAGTMFVCFLVVVIGHGVQGTPNGYVEATATTPASDLSWTVWAPKGTTFVQGMSAFLNILYTFAGQALIPSFVGEMAHPEDFPKALYCSMALELVVFTVAGAVVLANTGTTLVSSPAYGSLIAKYGRPAAALTLPTIICVGVLYSIITSRALFMQIFQERSHHRRTHTVKGWTVWVLIVSGGWIIAYIIGESIPFFNDLLSLISSLFDSWFGYILWVFCFWSLYKGRNGEKSRYFESTWRSVETVLNVVMLVTGAFVLVAGTYASAESIKSSYATGNLKRPFSCANSGFEFTR